MNTKKFLFVFLILIIGCLIAYYTIQGRSFLKKGTEAESKALYETAMDNYVKALMQTDLAIKYPAKNNSYTKPEGEWMKDIEKYISWVIDKKPNNAPEYQKPLDGIKRCMLQIQSINFITEKPLKPLKNDTLVREWKSLFLRENEPFNERHKELIKNVVDYNISLLRLKTVQGFVYTLKVLDVETGKRTEFVQGPESRTTFFLRPGAQYFLICRSEVIYKEGGGLEKMRWSSAETIIPFTAPLESSVKDIVLITDVARASKSSGKK